MAQLRPGGDDDERPRLRYVVRREGQPDVAVGGGVPRCVLVAARKVLRACPFFIGLIGQMMCLFGLIYAIPWIWRTGYALGHTHRSAG